ncbi:MAG TPA: MgtC/SapB family protein [Gaiellaceae bacterium]|jgi:putative Mg2+ transporter-C (MgtC) family protein|nr:MgtC/SapB family protein [Gaiellaceae bacterium]
MLALIAGQGWRQIWELALAFGLSSVIGWERELRQKSAGLRTHTLVGTGAALFLIVSKYGFSDVLVAGHVVLDPSRVAAQVVSGIGFIGGGLIFVRRDVVRGLTTAAIIWVTAAVGMACGAGLIVLALVVTALHLVVVLVYPLLEERTPRTSITEANLRLLLRADAALPAVLGTTTRAGFAVTSISTRESGEGDERRLEVLLRVHGGASPTQLAAELQTGEGVAEVHASEAAEDD